MLGNCAQTAYIAFLVLDVSPDAMERAEVFEHSPLVGLLGAGVEGAGDGARVAGASELKYFADT